MKLKHARELNFLAIVVVVILLIGGRPFTALGVAAVVLVVNLFI